MYNVTEVKYKLGKCRRHSWPNEKYYAGSVIDGLRQTRKKISGVTRRNSSRVPPKYKSEALISDPILLIVSSASDPHSSAKKEIFNCRLLAFTSAIFLIPHNDPTMLNDWSGFYYQNYFHL